MSKIPKSAVIVPLYQYPLDKSTWEPLYQAISDYPNLPFIVIINPNSGPGIEAAGWLPDKNYYREIPRLSKCTNVTIVGYVRLDYCKRPIDEVLEDLDKYANWSREPSATSDNMKTHDVSVIKGGNDLAMDGIFFDEVPNIWRERYATYLDSVNTKVKASERFKGERLTIVNCGTVPDPEYALHWAGKLPKRLEMSSLSILCSALADNLKRLLIPDTFKNERSSMGAPDVVVVFEESTDLWYDYKWQTRLGHLLRHKRESCCFMVHSVPPDKVEPLTMSLRHRGGYVFVTELYEKQYESFGQSWISFVAAMAVEDDEDAIEGLKKIEH